MAAFNFPNNPSDGDTHTENGLTYVWDATNGAWKRSPASLSKGEKGEKGQNGTNAGKGEKGDKGEVGQDGNDGSSVKGEPGASTKGEPGSSTKGQKGEVGEDGNDGSSVKGEPGQSTKGEPGSSTKGDKGEEGQKGESSSGGGVAGSDKQVQFNDNGSLAGADGLEFHKSTTEPRLVLKPSSSDNSTYGDGNIIAQTKTDTYGVPYNRTIVRADGGLELMRRRHVDPVGGPYIDFTSQLNSNNGDQVDFDARIQMDYANGYTSGQAINPSSGDYSAITFQTGGNGYYSASNPSNTQGRVVERLRIGKAGEIGILAGNYIGNGDVANNRTDAQKYGTTGQVLTSNGKGSSVSWETVSSGGSVTINNNADNRVITGSNTANTLNGETSLTWDGSTLLADHTIGQVALLAGNGCIELTRNSGDAFIDFKNDRNEDFDARIAQDGTDAALLVTGELRNEAVASAWVHFNGTGSITKYDDMNVSTITDYGVGDYQVNFTRQLRNSSNNVTDYQAVSFAINGGVYNVQGQLAHTHAFIYTGDKNHVRFLCHKTENSNQRVDQSYCGVIVFS